MDRIGLNLPLIAQFKYFNDHGVFVPELLSLSIIHEVIHLGLNQHDLTAYDQASLNGTDFDQQGDVVRSQNQIAQDMGWSGNIQPSYLGPLPGSPEVAALTAGTSYTEGLSVATVRVGTSIQDLLDHAQNTLKTTDLMLGLSGNDTIRSGVGDDFAYGGVGDDVIDGGRATTGCSVRPVTTRWPVDRAMTP